MATLETPTEGMARDFAAGQQLASGFMANYWRAKEGQLNEARYVAGQALRDVQLSVAQSQLQTIQNAATVKAQQDAAIPGLFGLAAKAQANDWNPDTRLEFLEFLQKNPALARSQEAQNVLGMFNESDKIRREREALELRLNNEQEVARIRAEREAVDKTPKLLVDKAGRVRQVTAGGATEAVEVFSKLEREDQESTIRELNQIIFNDIKTSKEKEQASARKKALLSEWSTEESRRLDELKKKVGGSGSSETEQDSPSTEDRKFAGWRAMIAGQDPNMVGNIPASPVAVPTQTQPAPSTNAFKIRLKSP